MKYPFDTSNLQLGDFIPRESIEAVFPGIRPEELPLKRLQVATAIRREFRSRPSPMRVTVVSREGGLLVCDHVQAAAVFPKRARKHWRGLRRSLKDALGVDAAALTEEQRREHDQNIRKESMKLQAAQQSTRSFAAPVERKTPLLVKKP